MQLIHSLGALLLVLAGVAISFSSTGSRSEWIPESIRPWVDWIKEQEADENQLDIIGMYPEEHSQFISYIAIFNKNYGANDEEYSKRFRIFKDNLSDI